MLTMTYREYAALPTGEYPARIVSVEEVEGKFGPQLKWTMDLGQVEDTEGNEEPRQLTVYTPVDITPKNKLGKLVMATGLELGTDMTEGDFINRRVILSVTRKLSDDGQTYFNRVEEFARIKAKANGKAAKPAVEADDDDTEL